VLNVKINLRTTLLASWFCFLFFGSTFVFTVLTHRHMLAPGSFVFSALGFFMLYYFGNIDMDTEVIRQSTLSGSYEIKWDDIKQIELRPSNATVVLRGEHKILTLAGWYFWNSAESAQIMQFIQSQAETRGIDIIEGKRSFRFPRNTKIES